MASLCVLTGLHGLCRCRFVHTDAVGDQLVQLKIVQVLQDIMRSPFAYFLSDESAWDVVAACFSLLLTLGIVLCFIYMLLKCVDLICLMRRQQKEEDSPLSAH